jgi:hypothetical protein
MDVFALVATHYLQRWWYKKPRGDRSAFAEPARPVIGRLLAALAVLGVGVMLLGLAGQS